MDERQLSGIKVNLSCASNERQLLVSRDDALSRHLTFDRIQNEIAATTEKEIATTTGKENAPKPVQCTDVEMKQPTREKLQITFDARPSIPTENPNDIGLSDACFEGPVVEPEKKYKIPGFVARKKIVSEDEKRPERLGIETIFPNVCFHFLNGECIEKDCQFSHTYPPETNVYAKLEEIGWENAGKLFRAIVTRCRGLVLNYFKTFARFFAEQRKKDLLIDMIVVCEHPRLKIIPFFGKLMEEFALSGLSYTETIVAILKNHRKTSVASLSIILNTENPSASDASIDGIREALHLLNHDPEFEFDALTVDFLLDMSCQIAASEFNFVIVKILERLQKRNPHVLRRVNIEKFKRFDAAYKGCSTNAGRLRITAP